MSARRGWLEVAERGSVAGIAALVVLATLVGRGPARAVLRLVAAYYFATSGTARRASRAYLERVRRRPATIGEVYRHLLRFAGCTLDRLFFVRGEVDRFEVEAHGEEHLRRIAEENRGAILLGAHLGSFEALRRMADARGIPVNIVGYFRNARKINAVLDRLAPESRTRLVEVAPEGVDFVLRIRELVGSGEIVSVAGDRVGADSARSVAVTFLGARARLPTGPYELAAALRCPVYLVFGLQRGGPSRYELHCEPFADEIRLPRRGRDEALAELAGRYARRLEHYCGLAPDNWFNFYDFWEEGSVGGREVSGRIGAAPDRHVEGRPG